MSIYCHYMGWVYTISIWTSSANHWPLANVVYMFVWFRLRQLAWIATIKRNQISLADIIHVLTVDVYIETFRALILKIKMNKTLVSDH